MVKIELIVDGGKAAATPQLAQSLGPLGLKIPDVLSKINEKTSAFKGMKVPVKLNVNEKDKSFTVDVGTPQVTQLVFKELNITLGSPKPDKIKMGNLSIEQAIKIAKMKQDNLFSRNLKNAVKTIVGSCNSIGVLVENKTGAETCKDIDLGKYDPEIKEEKTEPSEEKLKELKAYFAIVKEKQKSEEDKIKREAEEKAAAAAAKPEESAATPAAAKAEKTAKK